MYLLIHALVLAGGVISKLIALLFIANLQPPSAVYIPCRPYGRFGRDFKFGF